MFEFVAGLLIGTAISALYLMWAINRACRAFNQKRSRMLDEIEQGQPPSVIAVRVEQHGEQFYLYNNETDEFIVQVHDIKEVVTRAQRFNQIMNVVSGDPAVIDRLRNTAL
jgi:MFS superfamily sulfate permease-like transporter